MSGCGIFPAESCKLMKFGLMLARKEKHVNGQDDPFFVGDQYVFVALDSETKLIPAFRVGKRNAENAWYFMRDLSERVSTRMQLTTDGFRPYVDAVDEAFSSQIDYAKLVKIYAEPEQPD